MEVGANKLLDAPPRQPQKIAEHVNPGSWPRDHPRNSGDFIIPDLATATGINQITKLV